MVNVTWYLPAGEPACMSDEHETLERWHEEIGAAWLYDVVAEVERDPAKRKMFLQLGDAARQQASMVASDLEGKIPVFRPTVRLRLVALATRVLGPRRARPWLIAMKLRGFSIYSAPGSAVSSAVAGHTMPRVASDVSREHGSAQGGSLRAAVFGANDGLVSNTCLILGVAGAAADSHAVLITGVAGLLAGAFSMASGEYVSVRSQRELYEYQIAQEKDELERYPEEETEELALIYAARGVPMEDARRMTRAMLANPTEALRTLAREELGLNPDDLGSPWAAASSSFLAFAIGACLPLLPFLLITGGRAVIGAAILSAVALFIMGSILSLFSGRNALMGGLRMLGIGAAAGAATYGIGTLFGVGIG